MKEEITYQNDSLKGTLPLRHDPNLGGTGELRINRLAPLPLDSLQVRETPEKSDTNSGTESIRPTAAQLRYWWWQREKKLLVGDSFYIEPRHATEVVSSVKRENTGLHLPSREIYHQDSDWIIGLLIIVLVIFASIRTSYSKYLEHLFRSLFNYPTSLRMFREKNYPAVHAAYRLDIFFYIIFPVFIFQAVNYFDVNFSGNRIQMFLWCFVVTTGFFLLKKMAYKFTGRLTELYFEMDEYLFNMDNINRVTGMVLLPVVLVIMFFPFHNAGLVVYLGIFLLTFLYLKLLYRGILILFKKQFSIFYLFLYFCTLEFMPLVLLFKILSQ
jgi:hypothetical protein